MELLKNIKKNTLILLLITIMVLFFILKDNIDNIIKTISTMNYLYVLIAILFYFISIILKAYVVYKTINDKEKLNLLEAIKHNLITQFFNGITPFSTGGQPMEIYMLTEHNIKTSYATNVTIQNFVFYQTALVILGTIAVGYNAIFHLFPNNSILKNLVIIGFLINILIAIGLVMITFSKKLTQKIIHLIIKILAKLNIVKEYSIKIQQWDDKVKDFHISAKALYKRKKLFFGGVFINIISLCCLYIIPLFILYGFGNFNSLNILQTVTSSAYVLIIGSFVPIPGASGGIEYGFLKFYGNFIPQTTLSATLLIWRFITYYLGMIIGAVIFSLEKKVD